MTIGARFFFHGIVVLSGIWREIGELLSSSICFPFIMGFFQYIFAVYNSSKYYSYEKVIVLFDAHDIRLSVSSSNGERACEGVFISYR